MLVFVFALFQAAALAVNITPTPAYEQLKNVFVDRAPLHMPNEYISSSLSAYGHVINVHDLCVRGFKQIRTGTRMVTMSVLKPIPVVVKIANFPCSVHYTGQPPYCLAYNVFGHFARRCQQDKAQAPRKTLSKAGAPVQCSQPMEAVPSSPQPSLSEAAPVTVGAAPSCTSAQPPVDSALVVVPPAGMDTNGGPGPVLSPLSSVDGISSSELKKLVVEVSEFKETLSVSDEFSCHRQVTVVQRRSTSLEKNNCLQKPRSTAGAKKSFCLSVPSTVPPSTPLNSPPHASVAMSAVPDSVLPGTPDQLPHHSGKIKRTKLIREQRLLTSSSQLSAVKSPSSGMLVVAQHHLVEASVVCQDVSTASQPAITTTNRFSILGDEVDDLESLAGKVFDPLASPGAAELVGSTETSVDQINKGATPPAPHLASEMANPNCSATESPPEHSLQLCLSLSEHSAGPVVPLASPPPVTAGVEPFGSSNTSVSQTAPCITPPVPPFVSESDDPTSFVAEFSSPPIPSRQVLVPSLASVSVVSPTESSARSLALVVSSDSPFLPLLRQCDPLFPESPDLFSPWSNASEGLLTPPSRLLVSPTPSSGDSFYSRSCVPSFQDGASDHDFSDGDAPPSLLPATSEQSGGLADQSLSDFK